jgi:hypothetical protein
MELDEAKNENKIQEMREINTAHSKTSNYGDSSN